MKKFTKLATALMLGGIATGALAGCGGKKADLIVWTGFGGAYTKVINSLIEPYAQKTGLVIEHLSQKSYDDLQSAMTNAISTGDYPNVANGYPDHFAGYIQSDIQLALDPFIEAYNAKHGGDLLKDYYPEYLDENLKLKYEGDKGLVMGIPFNKSTEVMAYNGYFVDYAATIDPSLAAVPTTWDEWNVKGPKYLAVMETLEEKIVWGKVGTGDHATDMVVKGKDEDAPGDDYEAVLDFSLTKKQDGAANYRVLSYDSLDNMFITIVRQWGSVYTTASKEDMTRYGHGFVEFNTTENKDKTIAAMQYFRDGFDNGWFGLPSTVSQDSYSSTAFKNNKVMFNICSSGGLSYNVGGSLLQRLRIAPVPYKDADKKYVISQGTNLAMFDSTPTDKREAAFELMVELTNGESQGQFVYETGYYPASKKASASSKYQELINTDFSYTGNNYNSTKLAFQEGALVNDNYYMKDDANWVKFVDPGFVGSSTIRSEVKSIMESVCDKNAQRSSLPDILTDIMARLRTYDPDVQKK